jgi:hypothetical protein
MGHVARRGEKRNLYIFLYVKMKERNHLENLGVDGSIAVKWIAKK